MQAKYQSNIPRYQKLALPTLSFLWVQYIWSKYGVLKKLDGLMVGSQQDRERCEEGSESDSIESIYKKLSTPKVS